MIGVVVIVLFFTAPWLSIFIDGVKFDLRGDFMVRDEYSPAALVTCEARALDSKGLAAPIRAFEPGSFFRESAEIEILLGFWVTVFAGTAAFVLVPRRFKHVRFAAALFALAAALTLTELAQLSPAILLRTWRPPSLLDAPLIFRAVSFALVFSVTSTFAPRMATWLARVGAVAAVVDAISITNQQDWGPAAVVLLLALAVWLLPLGSPKLPACDSAPTSS